MGKQDSGLNLLCPHIFYETPELVARPTHLTRKRPGFLGGGIAEPSGKGFCPSCFNPTHPPALCLIFFLAGHHFHTPTILPLLFSLLQLVSFSALAHPTCFFSLLQSIQEPEEQVEKYQAGIEWRKHSCEVFSFLPCGTKAESPRGIIQELTVQT